VNGALLEAFRHNSWATRQLLAFCRASRGTARGVGDRHLRQHPGHLQPPRPRTADICGGWPAADPPGWTVPTTELDELAASAEEAGQLWERLLSEPTDADRVLVVDDGALEVRAGVIVAQALHLRPGCLRTRQMLVGY
jgi:uncharacterized damage-inducible protein DinB